MYAIALLRYRRPLEDVLTVANDHRAYLHTLKAQGTLLASGPLDPRTAGFLLLRVRDDRPREALDRIRDDDPYWKRGMVQYEVWPWRPTLGEEELARL